MTSTIIQNTIKIGTSTGVTLPAKELKRMGVQVGDMVRITFEPVHVRADTDKVELVELTQRLIKRHEKALKNLAER